MLKLDLDVPGKMGQYKGREAPFWSQFSSSGQCKSRSGVKEWARQIERDGDHQKTLKGPSPFPERSRTKCRHKLIDMKVENFIPGWGNLTYKVSPQNLSGAHRTLDTLAAASMLPRTGDLLTSLSHLPSTLSFSLLDYSFISLTSRK